MITLSNTAMLLDVIFVHDDVGTVYVVQLSLSGMYLQQVPMISNPTLQEPNYTVYRQPALCSFTRHW